VSCARTRFLARAAILALAVAVPAAFAAAQGTPARPVEVRGRLATGASFTGKVERWDLQGITGAFGTRAWSDFVAADLRRIFTQLMDRKSAAQWLALAELLGGMPDGVKLAEDAYRQAKAAGAGSDAIDAARARAKDALAARNERDRMERERRLQTDVAGEGAEAKPWPVLTDAEQAAACDTVREGARKALEVAGIPFEPVETRYFVLCGDLPAAEMQRWARELDAMYARVGEVLGLPRDVNLFWGRCAILAFQKEDTFKLVEAAVFNHKAMPGLRGVCHMQGPRTTVSLFRGNDELQFAATLVHETTHAIMHRWATPQRLPDWANEGFAEWVARACVPRSGVDASRRPQGLAFFRGGGDATKVMALDGAAGTWPGDNAIGYSVGYLLVDLMIAEKPAGFAAWVKAVKGGKPWRDSLAADFGADPARLAAGAAAWYRTNDGAPRKPGRK
jgi:hypothetical protein